jgi:hypothetical protein
LNFAFEIEKILGYDRFPIQGAESKPLGECRQASASRLPEDRGPMDTKVFCVYNLARGVFLSSKVTAADGVNDPLKILKVLVSGLGLDKESGLWICPLSAIPSVPRLFPFDLIYLDRDQRVVEAVEIVPGAEFPPYRSEVASALVLARQTVESTRTGRGDRLIICIEGDVDREIAAADGSDLEPITVESRSSGRKPWKSFEKNGKEHGAAASAVSGQPLTSAMTGVETVPVAGARVEPVPGARENPSEEPQLVAQVEDSAGSLGTAELPAEPVPGADLSTAQAVDAKAGTGEKPTRLSAEPVEIEEGTRRTAVNGQQGGFEDLFSNWVDAPSLSSTWIGRNPKPGSAPAAPSTAGMATSPVPDQDSLGVKPDAAEAFHSEPGATKQGATPDIAPENMAAAIERSQTDAAGQTNTTEPTRASVAAKPIVPQAPQATTFTGATFGMWRVSLPTASTTLAANPSPGARRSEPATPEKETWSSKETRQAKPAETAKAKDAAAKDSVRSSGARFAGDAGLLSESHRPSTPTAARGREPLEQSPKAEEETIDPRSGGAKQETGDGSGTGSDAGTLNRAVPERKSARDKAFELTIRQKKVQADVETARSSVSAQSRADAARVEGKAAAPVKCSPSQEASQKPAIERVDKNGNPKNAQRSLGARLKRWLNPVAPLGSDRRRAYRRYVPGMVAHYYTGGAPKPHEVADISMTGFYLLTDDRWMPETMIQMTLQKPCAKGERKQSITILSRVVRRGSDGVGAEFVMPEGLDPLSHDIQPSQATDRFALARFL